MGEMKTSCIRILDIMNHEKTYDIVVVFSGLELHKQFVVF